MKPFRWSPEKNALLQAERGVSFERDVVAIESGGLLGVVTHPNPAKSSRQSVMVSHARGCALPDADCQRAAQVL